jgi:hypothetical protein
MEIDLVLARFWGIVLALSCGAALVNARANRALLDAKETEGFTLAVGWLALIAGAAHVAIYNQWELSYRGLITFLGWITLVRAGLRLVAPTSATTATRTGRQRPRLVAPYTGLAFLMGVYLLLVGLGINVPR